ncbi:transcriptional regulator [Paenibacillus sp. FSL R7-0273]|uniref:helix-turn-helix transcriptional regulator n=1 Tax=Paenibacillus sp. FSL R7-0273 TaxID=1536772 RepID=UPI0004F7B3C8|nr:metalloregulator ArsR/SmtB family transcription factor [Paenibacillus sp. FSL R7-0273]AIQ46392.1 transcriptional regulator [Paenibacillus sp. FSL R7-0273]OMF85726.1 ArsR family transcriptional regulator [Paenibacillus sp. FSL R7-0273]
MKKGQESGSTRRNIMTLLKMKGPLTIGALAEELGITEMGVRRHVLQLEQESLAKTKVVRQAMGRPLHVYSLTERAEEHFPKTYHNLALELLRELDHTSGTETVNLLFEGRRRRMLAQYMPMMENRSLEERVAELSSIQNSGGYMAEWSKEDDGTFVMQEFNCPIRQVASQYRKACQCEQSLFEELLGAKVVRSECMAEGGHSCRYAITPVPPAKRDKSLEKSF